MKSSIKKTINRIKEKEISSSSSKEDFDSPSSMNDIKNKILQNNDNTSNDKIHHESSFLSSAYHLFFRKDSTLNEISIKGDNEPIPQMTAFFASLLGGWFGF